jgi:hypothetical protein
MSDDDADGGGIGRRHFLRSAAAAAALASGAAPALFAEAQPAPESAQPAPESAQPATSNSEKLIGIQVGAVSFIDEGVDAVLDNFQQRGAVNAIFLATFTYGRGIAGRQVPGQPLPDHGKQEYDQKQFHGGNYATPHPQFYTNTAIKQTRAPDHGDTDILELVLPKAKQRGMKTYCWYEDNFDHTIPGIEPLREIDLAGRRANTLCPLHSDYRAFLVGLTEDYCKSYDVDGVMWGSERQGPLNNAITHATDPQRATCFCALHQQAARDRGIDVKRALMGYQQLADFVRAASAGQRPTDGYFVTFWRLLLEYPEILAWEKLWTDSKHAIYGDIHRAAKAARPGVQVGFHIWHQNSFSPFFRAEQDYAAFARVADYLKVVLYNNCGGPRYARAVDTFASTIFRDVPADELQSFFNHVLNYGDEKAHADLPTAGLNADYVARETKRALDDVKGQCRIYPGIDIDVPTDAGQKKTMPQDVHDATLAALRAGADGVIFSRKYSEMRLANLSAGGAAVRESSR